MKKSYTLFILLVVIILCSNIELNAQRRNKAPLNRFGIRVGFNMSDLTSAKGLDVFNGLSFYDKNLKYVGFTDTKPFKYGFNVGFTGQIQLEGAFYLQPSLILTTKGYKLNTQNLGNLSQNVEINCEAYYVQLPIEVLWKYNLNEDLRFIAQAGAFLGYGVAGKTFFNDHYGEKFKPRKYHEQTWQPSLSNGYIGYDNTVHGIIFTDEDETFRTDGTNKFDAGLSLGIGMEFKSFQLVLNYQYSLTPLYDYKYDFSARYKAQNIDNYSNSFDYLKVETPTSPSQHLISLTLSYYLDFFSNKIKY